MCREAYFAENTLYIATNFLFVCRWQVIPEVLFLFSLALAAQLFPPPSTFSLKLSSWAWGCRLHLVPGLCSQAPSWLGPQQPGGLSTWACGSPLQGICPQPDFPPTCPHPAFPFCFSESCPLSPHPQRPKPKPASLSTSLSFVPHSGVTKPHHPCDRRGMGATGFTHSLTHVVKCHQTWPGERRVAYVPDLEDFLKSGGGWFGGDGRQTIQEKARSNRHIHNTSQAVCAVQKKAGRGCHRQTPQVPSSPRLVSTPHIRRLLPSPHKLPSSLSGLLAPCKGPPPLPLPHPQALIPATRPPSCVDPSSPSWDSNIHTWPPRAAAVWPVSPLLVPFGQNS